MLSNEWFRTPIDLEEERDQGVYIVAWVKPASGSIDELRMIIAYAVLRLGARIFPR